MNFQVSQSYSLLKGEELASVDYHYICFVKHQNKLYELDGLKDPVAHKETTSESFFKVLLI